MNNNIRPALVLFIFLTLLTGLAYPVLVTVVAKALFPSQASGSVIFRDGKPIGSALIGQNFTDPKNFWGRPSATGPMPYNATASSGSNVGPQNPVLVASVKDRISALRAADPTSPATKPVPIDLVTASASGLDPHISPAAAYYQINRIATARKFPADSVKSLVDSHIEKPLFGLLGEPRVNVLKLNLALNSMR